MDLCLREKGTPQYTRSIALISLTMQWELVPAIVPFQVKESITAKSGGRLSEREEEKIIVKGTRMSIQLLISKTMRKK